MLKKARSNYFVETKKEVIEIKLLTTILGAGAKGKSWASLLAIETSGLEVLSVSNNLVQMSIYIARSHIWWSF